MAEVLRGFLSPTEVAELTTRAQTADGWTAGRQHTGYDILPLRPELTATSPLVARALARIGTPFEDYWDVYFIRYTDGAHIPPHTDAAQHGKRHRRINAVLTQAPSGGELLIDGTLIALAVGDAVLFQPDTEVHEVTRVGGPRLLFSVGAWV
jgi:predicted 2-oxoglutarate/Fe(II)-dependent dioxygenase YbiX